ncbi:MAG: hypothetical protein M3235_08795 [Actinomycetota bacterium]|nr:hypothetical protein [Actinomycetota bacterium]
MAIHRRDDDVARSTAAPGRSRQARSAFADTTERAARTALALGPRGDLTAVRVQLDMPADQVPVLRSEH